MSERITLPSWRACVGVLPAVVFVLGVVFAAYRGIGLAPSDRWMMAGLALLLFGAAGAPLLGRFGFRGGERAWAIAGAVGLCAVLFSALEARTFFHLSLPGYHRTWAYYPALGALVAAWMQASPKRRATALLIAAELWVAAGFFDRTGGELVTRDDHPAFLYRLHLLREQLPSLVFYNPQWNAGYIATELIATGSLSFFLLGLPFTALESPALGFSASLVWVYLAVLPWLFRAALTRLGASAAGASLGALLSLIPTSVVFLYSLHYGLPPFVISASVAPLAAASFTRLFIDREGGWGEVAVLIASTSFCLLWPLGAVMLAPILLVAPFAARRLDRSGWLQALVVAGSLLALHLPWVWMLSSYGDSQQFLAAQRSPILTDGVAWDDAGVAFGRLVEQLHPVSLCFLPLGVFAFQAGRRRPQLRTLLWGGLLLWSMLVAVFGDQVKRDVALERFALPMAFFAAAIAALGLDSLLRAVTPEGRESPERRVWRLGVLAMVLASVATSTMTAALAWRNRGIYLYDTLPQEVWRSIAAIRDECPANQRVLIPGFSLHWMGGGHIAPLPQLAQRSFVGNDYYHRRDYNDSVPPHYRDGENFREFLELYDVGCILNWKAEWDEALAPRGDLELLHDEGWLRVYETGVAPQRFLQGSGEVREFLGGIVVESEDSEVVLKYRWFEGLHSDPPVPLEAVRVYGDVDFLRVRLGDARRVEIRF